MRLILAGCEYTGTSTLAFAIDDWMEANVGARFPLIHDHWKLPHTSGHPQPDMTEEERQQVLALSPVLREMTQRHSLYYHIQANSWTAPDWMSIGLHIDDSVYSPMYFGYGADHQEHDRKTVSRQVESAIMRLRSRLGSGACEGVRAGHRAAHGIGAAQAQPAYGRGHPRSAGAI